MWKPAGWGYILLVIPSVTTASSSYRPIPEILLPSLDGNWVHLFIRSALCSAHSSSYHSTEDLGRSFLLLSIRYHQERERKSRLLTRFFRQSSDFMEGNQMLLLWGSWQSVVRFKGIFISRAQCLVSLMHTFHYINPSCCYSTTHTHARMSYNLFLTLNAFLFGFCCQ